MRVSKAQAQANRAHIVETASELFRERGFDGVGVSDLMAAAGFTHGGFYKHFGSKADLMAEASASSLSKSLESAESLDVPGFIDAYDVAAGEGRKQMIDLLSRAVGAITLSRACPDDSALADEILEVYCAEMFASLPVDEVEAV